MPSRWPALAGMRICARARTAKYTEAALAPLRPSRRIETVRGQGPTGPRCQLRSVSRSGTWNLKVPVQIRAPEVTLLTMASSLSRACQSDSGSSLGSRIEAFAPTRPCLDGGPSAGGGNAQANGLSRLSRACRATGLSGDDLRLQVHQPRGREDLRCNGFTAPGATTRWEGPEGPGLASLEARMLRQDVLVDEAGHVGQPEVSSREVVGQLLVVHSEQVQQCCV